MNCPECNSENTIEGKLQGYCGVVFVEKGTENKLRPNAHKIACRACIDCGKLFDFRVATASKNKVGK